MKNLLFLLIVIFSLWSAFFVHSASADWIVIPGVRIGFITKKTSEAELRKIFGEKNVIHSDISVGEGETTPGTILFPNDARKKLEILWVDEKRITPRIVTINKKGTNWKTKDGITLGTPLSTIAQINKRSILLLGFGWDYGGTLIGNNGGELKELGTNSETVTNKRTLILRVEPNSKFQELPEYNLVVGDREFSSDDPVMKKLNPSVYEMQISFE